MGLGLQPVTQGTARAVATHEHTAVSLALQLHYTAPGRR